MKNLARRSYLLVWLISLLLVPATVNALELTDCKGALVPSQEGGCSGIDDVGCCDQFGRTIYCQGGALYCIDCTEGFQFCGWNPYGYYDCGQPEGLSDPSGVFPLACGGSDCPAQCQVDSPCSSECSGGCGHCPADGICLDDGSCYTPKCDGKECGKDPAGFSCGTCGNGTECVVALGKCLALPKGCVAKDGPGCKNCGCEACVCEIFPSCCTENWDILCVAACENDCNYDCSPCPAEPSCEGLECGDYCGVSCGKCDGEQVCSQFQCCTPSCSGKECGSDGCGGICGTCPGTDECAGGSCVACQPDCEGKECGGDGCEGTCGQCAGGAKCMESACVSESCVGSCGGQSPFECFCDNQCQDLGDCCDDVCIACPNICEGECNGVSWAGCCDGETVKWCQDGELHDENCGDKPSCGWNAEDGYYDCETTGGADPAGEFPLACDEDCTPNCFGKECGDDGCGKLCGECAEWAVCTGEGQCCESSCKDNGCGSDGCGGSCGDCDDGYGCVTGECVEGTCGGLAYQGCCAADGVLWWCENAEPKKLSCEGKGPCGWNVTDGYYNCATDGESDPEGLHPMACPPGIGCQIDCADRECGDDGCKGSCGTCDGGLQCSEGKCLSEAPDVVTMPDASVDVGGAKETTPVPTTKGGGCTVGSEPAAGSLLLLLLLPLGLLVRRRKVVATSFALVVFMVACGNSNIGTYTPDPDIVKAVDGAGDDSLKLDVELVDVAADSLPDVIADISSGELKPPPPIDLQAEVEVVDVEEDTGPEFNCQHIPQGPFELVRMKGVIASEDLAFDSQGFVVGSDNEVIFKSDIAGNSHIFSPNMKFRAGLAMLPNGWLVVNDNELNRLVKIDPDGVQYTLLTGLDYPNGIAIDMQGYIYITEEYANRVLRVHSYTGEYTVLTTAISHPNGICFNKDYSGLYIGSFGGGGWVYYMSLSPEGKPGKVIKWGDMTDTPALLDGIAVDYCGNVYVCEYQETEVYRFSPDGQQREKIVDATEMETYLPNLRFGAGPGWDNTSLYAPDGWHPKDGVWRIDIGVPAPKLPYP
jgi:sugar lactone lactonase YvrE